MISKMETGGVTILALSATDKEAIRAGLARIPTGQKNNMLFKLQCCLTDIPCPPPKKRKRKQTADEKFLGKFGP